MLHEKVDHRKVKYVEYEREVKGCHFLILLFFSSPEYASDTFVAT